METLESFEHISQNSMTDDSSLVILLQEVVLPRRSKHSSPECWWVLAFLLCRKT